jgi:hypothetical protein
MSNAKNCLKIWLMQTKIHINLSCHHKKSYQTQSEGQNPQWCRLINLDNLTRVLLPTYFCIRTWKQDKQSNKRRLWRRHFRSRLKRKKGRNILIQALEKSMQLVDLCLKISGALKLLISLALNLKILLRINKGSLKKR